jgi:hypothetical protein
MVTSFAEIAGLAIDNIRSSQCRLNTPPDRPRHPISRIAPRPAILGYARERVLIYGRIVMMDNMLGRLIKESHAVVDAVAGAQPRTWSDVHAIIVMAKRGAAKTRERVTSPREPSRSLKKARKSATSAMAVLLSALALEVAFQQHTGRNYIPPCSKCHFMIAWAAAGVANSNPATDGGIPEVALGQLPRGH